MANLIRNQNLVDTNKRTLVKKVFISDGSTNEANTVFIDPGSFAFSMNANNKILGTGTDRKSTYRTTIKRIVGESVSNNGIVKLQWHGNANSEIILFGKTGRFQYEFEAMGDGAVISNPEANSTGNVLITTTGFISGEGFTAFIDFRKDARDYDSGQTADPVAFNRGPAAGP
jgi:hypothetical protein